jgi:hypothetical protein
MKKETMITSQNTSRDLEYKNHHDPIYWSLDLIDNWLVYGHLSLKQNLQWTEKERLKRFRLLIRDTAKRFTGSRDLNALGWFLREEGNGDDKRFHFHFSITADHLSRTTPETVCRFLRHQWHKIGNSTCRIEPWDKELGGRGVWYLTQMEPYEVPESRYFHGDFCHWKMSTLLWSRIKSKG